MSKSVAPVSEGRIPRSAAKRIMLPGDKSHESDVLTLAPISREVAFNMVRRTAITRPLYTGTRSWSIELVTNDLPHSR